MRRLTLATHCHVIGGVGRQPTFVGVPCGSSTRRPHWRGARSPWRCSPPGLLPSPWRSS